MTDQVVFNPAAMARLRFRAGLSLTALALRTADAGEAVSSSQLSRIQRGVHNPSPRTVLAIAHALGVDSDDLLTTRPVPAVEVEPA